MYLLKIQTRMAITYIKLEELIIVLIAAKHIRDKQAYRNTTLSYMKKTSFTHSGYLSVSNVSSMQSAQHKLTGSSTVLFYTPVNGNTQVTAAIYGTKRWGGQNTKSPFTHFSWFCINTHACRKCKCETQMHGFCFWCLNAMNHHNTSV